MTKECLLLVLGLCLVACATGSTGAPQQPSAADLPRAADLCPEAAELPPDVEHPRPIRAPQPPAPRTGPPDGYACAEVTIDAQGRVSDPEIIGSNNTAFANSFARTVRTWRFHPATRDGGPVEIRYVLVSTYRQLP